MRRFGGNGIIEGRGGHVRVVRDAVEHCRGRMRVVE